MLTLIAASHTARTFADTASAQSVASSDGGISMAPVMGQDGVPDVDAVEGFVLRANESTRGTAPIFVRSGRGSYPFDTSIDTAGDFSHALRGTRIRPARIIHGKSN